jgi:uncharacterized tellurite resistance protein B-like protein
MNTFFRRSINEYQRQIGLKESFAIQTERLQDTIESINWTNYEEPPASRRALRRRANLLMLFPLVEIAWADGRISRRESDAIIQIAKTYGLTGDETGMCELLENLTSRPIPQMVGRRWQDFWSLFEKLPELDRENVAYCLTVQMQFVAEQSSDNLIAFLRGERVSTSEREMLNIVAEQLKNAVAAAKLKEDKRRAVLAAEKAANESLEVAAPVDDYFGESELEPTLEDYGKLIPLVPLVKTAWAEGRVTRRERHLVFEAAAQMGIKPGTRAHNRLAEWLELHPTAEFYDHALDILSLRWQSLDADEKSRRKFDLLNDCTRIAEASGGAKDFPSGGAKICDEEIAVVKHIARKLDPTNAHRASVL